MSKKINKFDWSLYKGNLSWLKDNTIYLARHGSHAYGTNIETSDEDFRGVAIPPKEYFFGINNKFEQAECKSPDLTIFDLRKFISLAADANPNILEILFVDDSDILEITELGEKLRKNRDLFISKKAKHTFSGYAISQLKRMKLHYDYFTNPRNELPTRKEFGLPERTLIPKDQLAAAQSAIDKKLAQWNFDDLNDIDPATRIAMKNSMSEIIAEMKISTDELWRGAARVIGYDENFIELLDRERRYNARKREFDQYQNWKKNRNPVRAALEEKYGFDLKHGLHLIRLMLMCEEILKYGKVIVKRPDREFLLSIRNGAWSFERIIKWAEEQEHKLNELYKTSKLPNAPNRNKIDNLCIELIEEFLKK